MNGNNIVNNDSGAFTVPLYTPGGFPLPLSTDAVHSIARGAYAVAGPCMSAFRQYVLQWAPDTAQACLQWVQAHRHPLADDLPLMDPIDVLFCMCLYFVGIALFWALGRALGKCEMKTFGLIHNIVLVCVSLYMALGITWDVLASGYSMWNNPPGGFGTPHAESLRNLIFLFYISKLYEYFDTYIMLLKHNYRQVTFLHLFHHTSVFVVVYISVLFAPGGDSYWCAATNSGVHVVMYTYYLLNLRFKTGPIRQFLQRHKFVITYGQMTQFILNLGQAIYILFLVRVPQYPLFIAQIEVTYMVVLFTLFGNFLMANKKKMKIAEKKAAAGTAATESHKSV